jgi:hypothetical protein
VYIFLISETNFGSICEEATRHQVTTATTLCSDFHPSLIHPTRCSDGTTYAWRNSLTTFYIVSCVYVAITQFSPSLRYVQAQTCERCAAATFLDRIIQTNKRFTRITYAKYLWIYLIQDLATRRLVDLPHDRTLEDFLPLS